MKWRKRSSPLALFSLALSLTGMVQQLWNWRENQKLGVRVLSNDGVLCVYILSVITKQKHVFLSHYRKFTKLKKKNSVISIQNLTIIALVIMDKAYSHNPKSFIRRSEFENNIMKLYNDKWYDRKRFNGVDIFSLQCLWCFFGQTMLVITV